MKHIAFWLFFVCVMFGASSLPCAADGGGVLKGRIAGPDGNPATDASLVLTSSSQPRLYLVTSAKTDGFYAFGDLEPGGYKLRAYLEGIGYAERSDLMVRPPFAVLVNLELSPSGLEIALSAVATTPSRFHGHASDVKGQDLAGVQAQLLSGSGAIVDTAVSDPHGRFHFVLEPGSQYEIRTDLAGHVPLTLPGLAPDPGGSLYGRFILQPKVFAFKTQVKEPAPEDLPVGGPERPLPSDFRRLFPPDDDDCDEPPLRRPIGPPELQPPPGPPPHTVGPPH